MIPGPPRRLQPSLASGARRRPAHLGRSAVAAGRPEWSVARPPCSTRRPDPTRGDATVRLLHSGPLRTQLLSTGLCARTCANPHACGHSCGVAVDEKWGLGTPCTPLRRGLELHPTATPEGQGGHRGDSVPRGPEGSPGRPENGGRPRRGNSAGCGWRRRSPNGPEGWPPPAGRPGQPGRRVGRIARAGLREPGDRSASPTAERGPSDAYSEGPSLCPG
jgi:hypothetical protein